MRYGRVSAVQSMFVAFALLGACEDGSDDSDGGTGGTASGGHALGGSTTGGSAVGGSGNATDAGTAGNGGAENGGARGGEGGADSVGAAGSTRGGGAGGASGGASEQGGEGGLGGGGAGGAMKTEGRRVELSPRQSWDAVATLALDQGTGGATLTCSRIAFSLRTEKSTDSERAGLFTAIASRDGDAPYNYLAKIADSYELAEGDWVLPARGSCPNYELAVSSLVLSALDENQDGVADRLVGTGAAYERTIEPLSDVLYGIPIEVSAVPDVTPPSFVQRAPMHPLDFATSFVEASEILDVAGDVRLSTHPDVPLLQVMLDAQPYGAHFFAEFEVLPFGGSWTVSSTKTDLVGLAVEGAWSLSTIDDPGILLDGGFEGTNLPMVSSGLVRRSTSVLGVPAISGDYSLVMRSDASATFHLAREAGTSQLSVRVRAFGAASQTNGRGFRFEAGVIGAKNIGRFDVSESWGVNIGSPSWTEGSIVNVVIPLDDPGDDVVVRIAGDCAPPCTDFRAIQVDDLRVE